MTMKKYRLKGFLFVLVIALLTSNNYAAEKLALEFNPMLGEKHHMRLMTENKIKQTIGGKQHSINHMKVTGLEFEIMEVDAKGISLIKVTYQTILEKTVTAAGNFGYDSTETATATDNPLAPTYTAMIGQSFMTRVTPKGEIVELKGLDEMFSRMAEKMVVAEDELISNAPVGTCEAKKENSGTVVSENLVEISAEERAEKRIDKLNKSYGSREKRKKALKEMIKRFPNLDEIQIMKMIRDMITVFTGRPVGIGDSWKAKVTPPHALLPEIGVTYTLKTKDKQIISVDASSKIDLSDTPDSTRNSRRPQMKMKGLCRGTLQIDKTSGWMIGKKVKMRLSGQVTQQGMTVPMSIESVVTVESTESIADSTMANGS